MPEEVAIAMRTGFTVEFTPTDGDRERVRYEPRSDNLGYWRIEEVWSGCGWHIRGREPVQDVVCEGHEAVCR